MIRCPKFMPNIQLLSTQLNSYRKSLFLFEVRSQLWKVIQPLLAFIVYLSIRNLTVDPLLGENRV